MSNQFLKLRRSAVPGRVPSTSSIDFGEIALNTYDGLAFIKRSGSMGEEVITLGSREGAFTGSFSGSFFGNGGGLFNIPASGIVGLNLSQIATGSVTASVSTGAGSFSLVSGSSTFLFVSSSGNVGIGMASPAYSLDVAGNIRANAVAFGTTQSPVISGVNGSLYHDINSTTYNYIWRRSSELMRLTGTGNLLLNTTTDDTVNRLQVSGSATFTSDIAVNGISIGKGSGSISTNTRVGVTTLNAITTGGFNTAIGFDSQRFTTTGGSNTSVGYYALRQNAGGASNTAFGRSSLQENQSGNQNTAIGNNAAFSNTIASFNSVFGSEALYNNTTGASNVAIGYRAGRYLSNGTSFNTISNSSIFIGAETKANADNETNQIVIGHQAIGAGSNTTTIGNLSTTSTWLGGNLLLGTTVNDGVNRLQVSGSARITDGLSVTGSITANNITVTGTLTAQTIVAQTITSSTDYVSGSTIFGNSLSNTHQFTGSVSITGSLSLPYLSTGSVLFAGTNGAVSQNNSNFFWDNTNGRLGIGTNAPGDTFQIGTNIAGTVQVRKIAVNDTTTTDFSNSAHFNANIATARTSFTISNSSSTSWVNNFTAISVVGASHPNNYYLTNISGKTSDAGYSMIINQGNQSNGLLIGTFDADPIYFGTSNTARVAITANGNVLLGSTSDSGERLQVSGSSRFAGNMVITGSGNTSATNALAVLNSSNLNTFRVRNDGTILIGNDSQNVWLFPYTTYDTLDIAGKNLAIYPLQGSISIGGGSQIQTSGNQSNLITRGRFAPQSGTATFADIRSEAIINQTGGANGVTRGIWIAPTLTNAADWRSIQWDNNAATAPSASWGLYGAGTAPNYINGNLLVGTTSNTGEKLNIGGNVIVNGSGGNVFFVKSSGGSNLFYIQNVGIIGFTAYTWTPESTTAAVVLSAGNSRSWNVTGDKNNTSGVGSAFFITSGFNPTSGTGEYNAQTINPTINQTGGANGITRGLYINPTITAVADFRSIEWSNNAATAPSQSWGLYGAGTAPNYMAGNLLVGTTSNTGEKLQVGGTMKVTGNVAVDTNVLFVDTANDRVGIGTASPSVLLHSSGVDGSYTNVFRLTNTANLGTTLWANTVSHDIQFHYTDGSMGGSVVYGSIRAVGNPNSGVIGAGTIDTDLSFLTAGYDVGGGLTEKFRIKATGQIRFVPRATAPSGAEAGDVYYNSTDNKHYGYDGTTWNAFY